MSEATDQPPDPEPQRPDEPAALEEATLEDAAAEQRASAETCPDETAPDDTAPEPKVRSRTRRLLLGAAKALLALFLSSLVVVVPWRWIPLPTTAFMVREHLFGQQKRVHYHWVPMEKISPNLAIAAVAAEDQLFPHHGGFDLKAISDALEDSRGRRRGASTISQQVAKNLFLWPGRSYLRKGLEAYLTLMLEATWPKRRILEVYLNVAEMGPGVYGAEAASRAFFGKGAASLTLREASLLAAVLPNPKGRSAARPSPGIEERAAAIRQQVRNLGGPGYLADL
jgi:monofunctional glycosyltransferase